MIVHILGFMQFITIAFICYYEFKLKSPTVFLWATLFIMFGIMHLYASFNGDITYSDEVLCQASLFALLFCFLYLLTRFMLVKLIGKRRYDLLEYDSLQKHCISERFPLNFFVLVLLAIIVLKTVPLIRSAGGLLFTSWGSGRSYSASLDYVNKRQIYRKLFYAFSGLATCSFLSKKNRKGVLVLLILTVSVIITRNRIEILPVFISIITIYLLKTKKLNIRTAILVIVISAVVIYVVYGLRVFRHYGSIAAFIENFELSDFLAKINLYIATDNGELGLRRVFYYFIHSNNNFKNFGKAHTYIRMLLVFIPTQWSFGIKPPDFAQSMGAAIGMVPGGSTHPTLFGDCYANLGWAGILLGVFWAIYASISDYIILKRRKKNYLVLMYSLFAVGYVIIGRGSVYNGFVPVAYGVVIIFVLEYLSRFKILKKVVLHKETMGELKGGEKIGF